MIDVNMSYQRDRKEISGTKDDQLREKSSTSQLSGSQVHIIQNIVEHFAIKIIRCQRDISRKDHVHSLKSSKSEEVQQETLGKNHCKNANQRW